MVYSARRRFSTELKKPRRPVSTAGVLDRGAQPCNASMSLEIQADPPAAEVQILRCGYDAACRARSCRAPAALIFRYLDGQGYIRGGSR
jgi:hypothetical protein